MARRGKLRADKRKRNRETRLQGTDAPLPYLHNVGIVCGLEFKCKEHICYCPDSV